MCAWPHWNLFGTVPVIAFTSARQVLSLLRPKLEAPTSGPISISQNVHDFFTYALYQVLMHIVRICKAEAAALLAATQQTADQIKEALAATQPQSEDSDEEEEAVSSPNGFSRIDAVRDYFEEHHRRKADDADGTSGAEEHAFISGRAGTACSSACLSA